MKITFVISILLTASYPNPSSSALEAQNKESINKRWIDDAIRLLIFSNKTDEERRLIFESFQKILFGISELENLE